MVGAPAPLPMAAPLPGARAPAPLPGAAPLPMAAPLPGKLLNHLFII